MSQIGPQPGQPAPDVTLPVTGGGEITLSAQQGGPVVLFFYPRDDTPGCTKESIGFSERLSEFAEAGVQVFGISRDSMDKHDKFAAKHALTVPLLSDTDGAVTEAYEVWVEKNMYGKVSMGIQRSTFLIDADGKVAKVWKRVQVDGHDAKVLEEVEKLKG